MGTGGPVDWFVQVQTADELVAAIEWARAEQVEYFVLGVGANIVFTDAGFRGLVIRNELADITWEAQRVTVASGVVFGELILAALERSLSGFEHFVGIPSTVGGAMWQNLHFLSPDRQSTMYLGDIVHAATIYEPGASTQVRTVDQAHFAFGYDDSILQHTEQVVLDTTFALTPASAEHIREVMWANAAWRAEKHPPGATTCSAGSIFRKIEGHGAGRLIDQAGLKGHRIGGMQISAQHANFFMNVGGGTTADLQALIDLAITRVRAGTGLELRPEVTIIGSR